MDALEAFLRVGQAGLQQGVNPKPQWGDPGKVRFARSPSAMQVRPLQRAALPSEPRPLRAPRQGTAAREPPRTLRAVGPGRHATAHAPLAGARSTASTDGRVGTWPAPPVTAALAGKPRRPLAPVPRRVSGLETQICA